MKHISSTSFQGWRTPRVLADAFKLEYDLCLDAAADQANAICPVFFDGTEGSNGLEQPWDVPFGGVWINPPYEDVTPWIEKSLVEVLDLGRCARAVLLVPAAVGVSWFTRACKVAEVHLFDERIRFDLPAQADLPKKFRDKLYTAKGKPKVSPGGGNALIIVERDGLIGITALRSAKTGRLVFDFTDCASYPD